jgi:hypothetical protein
MAPVKTWSTDVREFVPAPAQEETGAAAHRAAFTRALVEAATSRHVSAPWCSAVRCIARVGRKACRARVHVGQPEAGRVDWSCSACGERGVISGFEGTELDLSSHVPRGKKLCVWGFDDESREVLLAGTTHIPSLRAVVARASPAAEIPGLLVLQATLDELDEIYTLVEELTDATRSRRRIELLDDLRMGLCSAMDGF